MRTKTAARRLIMIVEDDDDIRDVIAGILEFDGCEVWTAANGKLALECLKERAEQPALILLDLMMPIMDGWAFRAEQARDPRLADIPVVVLSANSDARHAATKLGAAGWLKKPLDMSALLEAVGGRD